MLQSTEMMEGFNLFLGWRLRRVPAAQGRTETASQVEPRTTSPPFRAAMGRAELLGRRRQAWSDASGMSRPSWALEMSRLGNRPTL